MLYYIKEAHKAQIEVKRISKQDRKQVGVPKISSP